MQKKLSNEVECRDDTVPKTGDTRTHCTVESRACNNLPQPPSLHLGFWGLRKIVAYSRFLFITLVEHGCSVSDKFYRLQHFWYNVVIACFARFPRFLIKFSRQIQKIRNRKNLTNLCYYIVLGSEHLEVNFDALLHVVKEFGSL